MREEKVKEVITNIESELSSLKERLSGVEALIRYAQLELVEVSLIIQNLSMQRDTLVCKSPKKVSKEVTCMCGEKQEQDYQLIHDPVKIAQDFWKSCKLGE